MWYAKSDPHWLPEDLHWLPEDTPLNQARQTMERESVAVMLVQAVDGKPRGLLRIRDVGPRSDKADSLSVGEACGPWVSVDHEDSLDDALETLRTHGIPRVPVVSNGDVIGSINRSAIDAYRAFERELGFSLGGLVYEVSPRDDMFNINGSTSVYLTAGLSALQCIKRGLDAAQAEQPGTILDFGCGHGRTLRFLQLAFPDAALTATDVDSDAVDFCRQAFGVRAITSHQNPRQIDLPGRFDLIWVGSVMTHVDRHWWPLFLQFFESHLAPGGVLIFTVAGQHPVDGLRNGEFDYGLPDEAVGRLLAQFDGGGFGYVDYPGQVGYGVAISSPSWVRHQVRSATSLRIVDYCKRGCGDHQDVVTCVDGTGG